MLTCFDHALNDGKVTVYFWYDLDDPEYNRITRIEYQGIDISEVMNPEDYDHFVDMLSEKAFEDKAEARATAIELCKEDWTYA